MLRNSKLWWFSFVPAFAGILTVDLSAQDEKHEGDPRTPGARTEPVSKGDVQSRGFDDNGNRLLTALNEFQIAIRKCLVKESGKAGALTVGLTIVPEAYRFQLMEAFLKLLRDGRRGEEFWRRLRQHHAELKSNQGKTLLRVSIQGTGNFFLQSNLKGLLRFRARSLKSLKVGELKPVPSFENWKIIESATSVKTVSLARFQSAEFEALLTWSVKPRDSVQFAVGGIASQTLSGDRNNSISLPAKQISCRSWSDLILPEVRFTLRPADWKVPELPREVEAFLASDAR